MSPSHESCVSPHKDFVHEAHLDRPTSNYIYVVLGKIILLLKSHEVIQEMKAIKLSLVFGSFFFWDISR